MNEKVEEEIRQLKAQIQKKNQSISKPAGGQQ